MCTCISKCKNDFKKKQKKQNQKIVSPLKNWLHILSHSIPKNSPMSNRRDKALFQIDIGGKYFVVWLAFPEFELGASHSLGKHSIT
jgi:hypothetical protein